MSIQLRLSCTVFQQCIPSRTHKVICFFWLFKWWCCICFTSEGQFSWVSLGCHARLLWGSSWDLFCSTCGRGDRSSCCISRRFIKVRRNVWLMTLLYPCQWTPAECPGFLPVTFGTVRALTSFEFSKSGQSPLNKDWQCNLKPKISHDAGMLTLFESFLVILLLYPCFFFHHNNFLPPLIMWPYCCTSLSK